MNRNIKLTVILCLVFVALVFLLTYYRVTRNNAAESLSPEELRELGALVYERPVTLSPINLVDQTGETFNEERLKGKWTFFFFGFTHCPDICPLTLTELSQFYRELKTSQEHLETQIVMVSVDPYRDDAEQLSRYMSSFDKDFIGLTGPYDELSRLAKELYIAHSTPPITESSHEHHSTDAVEDYVIDHSGNILIINPEGLYHGFMDTAIQDDEILRAYRSIKSGY